MRLSCVCRTQMRPCRQQTKKVMSTWSLTIYDSGVQCFFCFPEVLIISLHHNGGRQGQVGGGRGDNRERYWWGFLRPEEGDGGHLDTGHVSRWARAQPAVILNCSAAKWKWLCWSNLVPNTWYTLCAVCQWSPSLREDFLQFWLETIFCAKNMNRIGNILVSTGTGTRI